eukprot:sb/3478966/
MYLYFFPARVDARRASTRMIVLARLIEPGPRACYYNIYSRVSITIFCTTDEFTGLHVHFIHYLYIIQMYLYFFPARVDARRASTRMIVLARVLKRS